MENPKPSRREFCAHAISFVPVASLREGCGGGGRVSKPGGPVGGCTNVQALSQVNGTTAGNTVTVNIGSAAALASVGSAALVTAGNNSILVTRTGQDSFNAFTA